MNFQTEIKHEIVPVTKITKENELMTIILTRINNDVKTLSQKAGNKAVSAFLIPIVAVTESCTFPSEHCKYRKERKTQCHDKEMQKSINMQMAADLHHEITVYFK